MADDKKGGVNPVAVGIAGAVVGAAAAAGAIVLADEKNRKKLEKVLGDLKDQGFKVMEVVSREAQAVKDMATGSTSKEEKKTPKKVAAKTKAKKGGK